MSSRVSKVVALKVGPQGPPGRPGLSAYESAVNNGYVGTEEEWLESLRATPGNIDGGYPDSVYDDDPIDGEEP